MTPLVIVGSSFCGPGRPAGAVASTVQTVPRRCASLSRRLGPPCAIRNIEDKRARERAKQAGKPRAQRTAPGKLVEGFTVQGWTRALNELAIRYPERFPQTN